LKITRLRALGFKSFVEPTELLIEHGLTGVVGPNGCGKSNLLEAIRWAMGETSFKSMRGAGMDDVIFAGTQNRPARNMAEVTLFIDNAERMAPAEFNDSDVLEVTRRIEREAGSAFKINGKDVRARDVRLLFEDAATGARSPALVRQGRIGEIINAKPQERRRLLEDAAGISGLHSRRHEAELRLKASESNLERLADLEGQLDQQLKGLNRQARQARRYKSMSSKIREAEALKHHIAWTAACDGVTDEEQALQQVLREVADLTKTESEALRAQGEAAEALAPLREEEAKRAAVLQRLSVERDTLEQEEARAAARVEELETRSEQMARDAERERELMEEAKQTLGRLDEEEKSLGASADASEREAEARAAAEQQGEVLRKAEADLSQTTSELAEARAEREHIEDRVQEARERIARLETKANDIASQLTALDGASAGGAPLADLESDVARLAAELQTAEAQMPGQETALNQAREAETTARETAAQAKLQLEQLETERRTLKRIVEDDGAGTWSPILQDVQVAKGLEAAVSAALGDDLDAPSDASAPAHWSLTGNGSQDPALPDGVEELARHVKAPPELARRLAQIGLVDEADAVRLQGELKSGQRLVSRAGGLWRWDGFSASAEAPSNAAKRLAARNRLSDIEREAAQARSQAEDAQQSLSATAEAAAQAQTADQAARQAWSGAQAALATAREALAQSERASKDQSKQLGALGEAASLNEESLEEARQTLSATEQTLAEAAPYDALEDTLETRRAALEEARGTYTNARASLETLEREAGLARSRLEAIGEERTRLSSRIAGCETQIKSLSERIEESREELEGYRDMPGRVAERRNKILDEIGAAEKNRNEAADDLARAETALQACDQALREAQSAHGEARETRARIEARLEAARERRAEQVRQIRDILDCSAEACLEIANLKPNATLPSLEEIDIKLSRLKAERERLGGVNLRAEEEAETLAGEITNLVSERDDLEEAIQRLRQGISSLNREGRKRLLGAFDEVNSHFQKLFETLFGGGSAELQLIESDDPLESGLEILAKPPGKKPQVLTLLSGGEKALTALALIFAVFLTNPSPICVLDEVDAPLDDANVERFCKLMEEMRDQTDTRFLIITHHPYTMSHVDRLFGVTMAERGISQLVSVDLAQAEEFRESA
jgi:chromosome segregation protein